MSKAAITKIPFYTTDVFTDKTFGGAQVAVIPDAETLNKEQMQKIASELNLWSTAFVSGNDGGDNHFSLRLFTPHKEIEFGSHTTIAAAHVLASTDRLKLQKGHTPLKFDHNHGSLDVHVTQTEKDSLFSTLSLVTEPVVDNYVPSNEELAELLSIPSSAIGIKNFQSYLVANQGVYIVVPIRSLKAVYEASFNKQAWNQSLAPNTLAQQIILFSQETETAGSDFHLRLLGPLIDEANDPPIGSAIPAFSAFLCAHKHVKKGTYSFIAERGLKQKRQSLLHVEIDNKQIDTLTLRIGGTAVLVCEGIIQIH
ncbi:PhzF family phenazine biosynthesis protein [Aurantivibrio infirmus]